MLLIEESALLITTFKKTFWLSRLSLALEMLDIIGIIDKLQNKQCL